MGKKKNKKSSCETHLANVLLATAIIDFLIELLKLISQLIE